jgi:hypothetical protein
MLHMFHTHVANVFYGCCILQYNGGFECSHQHERDVEVGFFPHFLMNR